MRKSLENWFSGLTSSQAMAFMFQLGSAGTHFPTLIVESNAETFNENGRPYPTFDSDRDLVVVRRFYTA